ncbi:MAG: polyisoprenoid-binding protein [Sulfurospirillum sp.]|nr:polyisoprenoid-binding protein [Sulfurospirillum sp.]
MKRLFLIPMLIALLFNFANADEYVIDTAHSHVAFSVKHMTIATVKGEFKKFDGEIEFDTQTKKLLKLTGSIESASIETGIIKRDGHLKSADFFDAQKFANIEFVATKITDDAVIGNLSIKGITKEITLEPSINGVIKDFQGNTRVGFSLEGKINRKDFGLTWNKLLESGGVVVGDKIKIMIDIEAIKL